VRPICTVFLDRDGVINRNRADYVKSWSEFRFLPGARWAVAQLTRAGYRVFVVTNQACVGKGLVSPSALDALHRHMAREIGLAGGRIEAVLCCTHRAEAGCTCRKPAPGMLHLARDRYGVDLSRAIFIGDSASDVGAAAAVGMQAMLVLSGLGWRTAQQLAGETTCEYQIALNLAHAARLVLARNAAPPRHTAWLFGSAAGAPAIKRWGIA
jgi:D-glycero-D-manno-heptose 1,7-bisphosphate phosphatase